MIDKEFVPYQEALELKKLGFRDRCFGLWWFNPSIHKPNEEQLEIREIYYFELFEYCLLAPTFSQAFRFFREKYNIRQNTMDFIDDETGIEWDYEIAIVGTELDEHGNYKPLVGYSIDDENRKFKTHEEAELACLKKLIEIVKEKSK